MKNANENNTNNTVKKIGDNEGRGEKTIRGYSHLSGWS